MKDKQKLGSVNKLMELHNPFRLETQKKVDKQQKTEFHQHHIKNGVDRKTRREYYKNWKKNK